MSLGHRLSWVLALLTATALWLLFQPFNSTALRFTVEAFLLLLLGYGFWLIYRMQSPLRLLREGLQQLKQNDYTSRIRKQTLPEFDQLIDTYNKLLSKLHRERLELGEARGLLTTVLEYSPSGLIILDFDGYINQCNPAALAWLGMDQENAATGQSLTDLDHLITRRIQHLAVGDSDIVALADGRRVLCQHGEFIDRGFKRRFYLLDEVTSALEEREKLVWETLIRTISHEVNNTVAAGNSLLDSVIELMPEENAMAKPRQALTVVIDRNAKLAAFVKRYAQLVEISTLHRQPSDLSEIFEKLKLIYSETIKNKRLQMTINLQQLPLFELDHDLFEQAVSNILLNAIQACQTGDQINIHAQASGQIWYLYIDDSADQLKNQGDVDVFAAFYTSKDDGQGIGLMLVKEILRRHDLQFGLTPHDGWTRFWIELPPATQSPAEAKQ